MKSIVVLCMALPWVVGAAAKEVVLKVGDEAPDFQVVAKGKDPALANGLKLSDFQGKGGVLVAFFPKAFTPGCTTQLCGYRDDFSMFQDANVEVIAVSVDEQAEDDRFKAEKKFPFYVVGDPEREIVGAYGVPLMEAAGNKLAKRSVFLVDKAGVIQYIDRSYSVTEGKKPLYDAIAKLKEGDKTDKK